jgi:hypothetical protein
LVRKEFKAYKDKREKKGLPEKPDRKGFRESKDHRESLVLQGQIDLT